MEFLQASGITLEMLTSGAPLPKISHVPNGLAVGLWQTAQNLNLQFYEVISWLSNFTEENAEINAEALRAQLHRTKAKFGKLRGESLKKFKEEVFRIPVIPEFPSQGEYPQHVSKKAKKEETSAELSKKRQLPENSIARSEEGCCAEVGKAKKEVGETPGKVYD